MPRQPEISTVCPHCERQSTDTEFCDFCNKEIRIVVRHSDHCPQFVSLANGVELDCSCWMESWPSDPATFFLTNALNKTLRVHGIGPKDWLALKEPVTSRAKIVSTGIAPTEVVECAGGAVVATEATSMPSALNPGTIPRPFDGDWIAKLQDLAADCLPVQDVFRTLHVAGFVWLNFDPGSLERHEERLRITNLDLGLYHFGECPELLRISPMFSPPEVCRFASEKIGVATDVYHLAAFLYYQIAGLPTGFSGAGLSAFAHEFPQLRIFQPTIPPGISNVIRRALSREPGARYSSVDEFMDAFHHSIERARERYMRLDHQPAQANPKSSWWSAPRRWFKSQRTEVRQTYAIDISGSTIAGLAKSTQNATNQDAVAFGAVGGGNLPKLGGTRPAAYAFVADGVSTARAGSGEVASEIACAMFQTALESPNRDWIEQIGFPRIAIETARAASSAIVARALTFACLPADLQDSDLMSTTAVLAVCVGHTLHIANIGDSRVYLITKDFIDQLTVDGDVAAGQLASGTPPEQVAEMGSHAKALRFCLGGAKSISDNTFVSDPERCLPQVGHWPLTDGDVILVCSDGLIEEGVFLAPEDAAAIVYEHADATAERLASLLVAAADARQRQPSSAEPQGFGDNIACIVMKFSSAQPSHHTE